MNYCKSTDHNIKLLIVKTSDTVESGEEGDEGDDEEDGEEEEQQPQKEEIKTVSVILKLPVFSWGPLPTFDAISSQAHLLAMSLMRWL